MLHLDLEQEEKGLSEPGVAGLRMTAAQFELCPPGGAAFPDLQREDGGEGGGSAMADFFFCPSVLSK